MHSALYRGHVRHRRFEPFAHEFQVRLALLYVDLAELAELDRVSRWLGVERLALASLRRADHFCGKAGSLDAATRELVLARLGRRPEGPIRLLTQPRVLGHGFNPLSLYFCLTRDGERLDAVVAEVTNLPWGERHCYVLDALAASPQRAAKALHVSPFLGLDQDYGFRLCVPGQWLRFAIENRSAGRRVFSATLALSRCELDARTLRRALLGGALVPARTVAAIHLQALRLWLRGAPFHAHPRRRAPAADPDPA